MPYGAGEITKDLSDALGLAPDAVPDVPEPVVVLAWYLDSLAKEYGLSESGDIDADPLDRVNPPAAANALIDHCLANEGVALDADSLRGQLYAAFVEIARDRDARGLLNKSRPLSDVDVLYLGQVYWNIERNAARPRLPIRERQTITVEGVERQADIKVPGRSLDFATMTWAERAKEGTLRSSGGSFRKQGARLSVLVARRMISVNDALPPHALEGLKLRTTRSARGVQGFALDWPEDGRDDAASLGVSKRPLEVTRSTPALLALSTGDEDERRGLDAEREFAAAVGCQLPSFVTGQKPDWRRLLSGAALGPAEVLAGLAVPRVIHVRGHGAMDERGVLEWMKRETQEPLFLSAPAGEGKSTYCTQLMAVARPGRLLLRLVAPHKIDWHEVARLQEAVQLRLSTPRMPHVLVIWEINAAHLEAPDRNHALDVIQSLGTAEFPGPVSLLIAGLPSVIRPLCAAAKGTMAWFAPLNESDVPKLTSSVRRCVDGIASEPYQVDVDQQFPNVRRFLRLSALRREELLLSGTKPLIAGMLEASFGPDWRARITSSYDELSKDDRLAYVMVCLGTLVSGGVSSSLVLDASPGADIDGRAQYDPWIADGSGNQSAIHATIARAVLELCPVEVAIGQCLSSLCASAAQRQGLLQRWSLMAIQRLLRTIAHWAPLARDGDATESVRTPAQLRRVARRWVTEEADQLDSLIRATSGDIQWTYVWFEVVEGTIPSDAEASDLNRAVVEMLTLIAQHAERLPIQTESQAHCLEFMRSLTEYWTRRTSGEDLSVTETVDYVSQWVAYAEEPWVDRAYHFSVLRLGFPAFFDLAYSGDSDAGSDSMLTLCHGLGLSYMRLDAEVPITGYLEAAYIKMVSNVIPTLWPAQAVTMLSALWMRSVIEGRPSFGTAASMVRRLKSDIRSSKQTEAPRLRARLAELLKEAVEFHGVIENLDLVVEYLDVTNPDYESLERCEQTARDALDRLAENRRTVTFAHDVLSRVLSERADVQAHLLFACDGYSTIVRDRSDVVAWDGYWKSALARLRELNPTAGEQATRTRADRLRRLS